ncbi:MAG TPA: hypothetical protein PLK35_03760 [Candidatus Moranbacteria bacterium]|nr:hypothetical protein [Candidatus Moranbacteria bacterium]
MKKVLFILVVLALAMAVGTDVFAAFNPPLVRGETYFLKNPNPWDGDPVYFGLNYRVREGNNPLEVERMIACVPAKDLFNDESRGNELLVVPWITGVHPDESDVNHLRGMWLTEAGCFSCEGRSAYQSARFMDGKSTYDKVLKGTDRVNIYPRMVLPGSSAPGTLLSWMRNHVYWTRLFGGHYSGFSFRIKENRTPADVEIMVLCVGGVPTPWISGIRLLQKDLVALRALYGSGCFTCAGVPEYGLAVPTDGRDDPYVRRYRKPTGVPKISFPSNP